MQFSESVENIFKAMSIFQSIVEAPKKSATNKQFGTGYSELQDVIDAIQPAIKETKLSYLCGVVYNEKGHIGISVRICHESGEWILFPPIFIPLNAGNAQQVGSARTYAMRYALSTAFGLASETDDDGISISQQTTDDKQQTQQKKQQQSKKQAQPNNSAPQQQKIEKDPIATGRQSVGIEAKKKGLTDDERRAIVKAETGKDGLSEVDDLQKLRDLYKLFKNTSAQDLKEMAKAHLAAQQPAKPKPYDGPITEDEINNILGVGGAA